MQGHIMKKKITILLAVMVLLAAGAVIIALWTSQKESGNQKKEEDKIQVLTTFYPVYMIGLNIMDQIEEIEVKSLTDINTGCLHDYQLTTEDMKSLASADIIVINGGGMESFLEDILGNYPDLKVIDASQDISMLPNDVWEIGDEHEDEAEFNSHVWLDPKLYQKQIENVRDGVIDYIKNSDKASEQLLQQIESNSASYIQKVEELDTELDNSFNIAPALSGQAEEPKQAIIFHNAFEYLAGRTGLEVTYTVPLDSDTALNASDIADIIDAVNKDHIKYLFTEKQYGDSIANRIEAETEAKVYLIDSAVTGDGSKDSYLKAMQNNIKVLKEALELK
jgi:zinc transport system substrate-binding protein